MSQASHKNRDFRRATIIVVASTVFAISFALFFTNTTNSKTQKSSFLTTIENKQTLDKKIQHKKEDKRSDIKVLELQGFGSVKN